MYFFFFIRGTKNSGTLTLSHVPYFVVALSSILFRYTREGSASWLRFIIYKYNMYIIDNVEL